VANSTSGGSLGAARPEAEQRLHQGSLRPCLAGAGRAPPTGWVEKLTRLTKSKGITVKSKGGVFDFAAGVLDNELR